MVTVVEDSEASVVDVVEVSKTGLVVGDVERVPAERGLVNGGLKGAAVGICVAGGETTDRIFLGRGERRRGTQMGWECCGTWIVL